MQLTSNFQNPVKRPYYFILFILFPLSIIYGRYLYATCDDAYIFFIYARNFVEGNGLTYNGILVEGFSSILWVFMISILGLTKISIPFIGEGLSILSGLFALFTTYFLATRLQIKHPKWALLPCMLLVATGDFVFYMSVGLEQVLFTGFIALNTAISLSDDHETILKSYYFPLLLALMILTRPEGALIAGLLLLILLIRTQSLWLVIRCGITLTIFLVPIFIAKWSYYGYWLPNTYYVKSGAGLENLDLGIIYLGLSIFRYGFLGLAGIILVFFKFRKTKLLSVGAVWFLIGIISVWLTYITVQGGDNMVGGRMIVPILPLIYVVVVKLIVDIKFSSQISIGLASLLIISLIIGYLIDPYVAERIQIWRDSTPPRRATGLYLHENFPSDTLVALNPAGIIPYYSKLPTIDMLGLNDIYIAHQGKRNRDIRYGHQAGDGIYILLREPDIILFGAGSKNPGRYISDQEIWNSAKFQENYELQTWPVGQAYMRIEE